MDAIAWAAGSLFLAILTHVANRSFLKASVIAAAAFSAAAIFVWPLARGQEISNIWPIAMVFQFVCAFLVALVVGIPFIFARRRSQPSQ